MILNYCDENYMTEAYIEECWVRTVNGLAEIIEDNDIIAFLSNVLIYVN